MSAREEWERQAFERLRPYLYDGVMRRTAARALWPTVAPILDRAEKAEQSLDDNRGRLRWAIGKADTYRRERDEARAALADLRDMALSTLPYYEVDGIKIDSAVGARVREATKWVEQYGAAPSAAPPADSPEEDEPPASWAVCPNLTCPGNAHYPAPGRGHASWCHHPTGPLDAPPAGGAPSTEEADRG